MPALLYIFVLILFAGFLIASKRSSVLSPPAMYFVGTCFFIFLGAITNTAELWVIREDTAWAAFWAVLLSLVCIVFGYWLVYSSRTLKPSAGLSIDPAISCRMLSGLFGASFLIKVFLDPDTIIGNVYTEVARPDTVLELYFSALVLFPTALACICPWLWKSSARKSIVDRALIIGIAFLGLISLSRTPIFYILGTWLLFCAWRNRSIWANLEARLLIIAVVVLASPALIFSAALVKGSNLLIESFESGVGLDVQVMVDYAVRSQYELAVSDAYGNFLYILDSYPSTHDYMPGLTPAVLATALIPRSIFEWKPWSASYHVTNQILGSESFETTGVSLATSFLGDMWINGGWPAIVVGTICLGAIGGGFALFAFRNRGSTFHELIFMMSLVMFILIPRGDVFSTFFRGMTYIVTALAIGYLLRRFSKTAIVVLASPR